MVYHDLSHSSSSQKKDLPIAPAIDRFLAFVFDLVIFTPIFSFILAQVFRQVELMYFVSPQSVEFLVFVAVAVLFAAILTILFQTLFLLLMGATPGKYFFKMKVVSVASSEQRLLFSQAFLRSVLWVGELFLFALPWLEVMSDAGRRPLHDRAAGTMVITKKGTGDLGPHHIESQFVRQILVFCSLLAMIWTIFTVGHFYQQAVRGDFKRAELEADEYLCPTVTQSMNSGVSASTATQETRIDKALALYLAGEISEICLASEADFVLWAPSETEKSWAYLAKGLLLKQDQAQFEAYLQKACDQDETGPACGISEFQANPRGKPIPPGSQTALILQVIQDFESGKYEIAEKGFIQISRQRGFEVFSQQGIVKSLWAQNQIEKSKGAYLNVVHQMRPSSQAELATWICHEELDRHCSQEAIEACEDLKKVLRANQTPIEDSFAALAIIREKECRQTNEDDLVPSQKILADKKDLLSFVRAISRASPLNPQQRQQLLKDIGFRKEPVRPQFLRLMAIQNWVQQEKSEEELKIAVQFLKEKKIRDLSWVKIYQKTRKSLAQLKSEKLLKEIARLPSQEMIQKFHLDPSPVLASELNLRAPASIQKEHK